MKKASIRPFLVLILAGLLVLSPSVGAQGQTLSGRVRTSLSQGSLLVIDVPGQQQQLNLNAGSVVVTRDGQPARLTDLQAGDLVTIEVGPDNVAQKIDARSSGGPGATRIAVGTVNDNNEGQLTLMTQQMRQQFTIPPGAYVNRDGQQTELGSVKVNDSATLVISSTGAVQAVFARPDGRDYRIEGAVADQVGPQSLALRAGPQIIRIPVPDTGVAVKRNGRAASLDDIRPTDDVTVRFNELSQPTAIDATGSGGLLARLARPWLLLLCLVVLLVLAGLFLWRSGRLQQLRPGGRARRRGAATGHEVDDLG